MHPHQADELVWKFEIGMNFAITILPHVFWAYPVVTATTVYTGSIDGNLYTVDKKFGREQRRFETEHQVFGSPVVDEGVVYFVSADGYLYAVNTAEEKSTQFAEQSGEKR